MSQKLFRNKFLRNSIQAKIILILIMAVTVIFAVIAFAEYFMVKSQLKRDFYDLTEYIANHQSKSLALPLWYMDDDAIEDVLFSGMAEKQVYAIQILEAFGNEYGKTRDAQWDIVEISKEPLREYYLINKEIIYNDEKLGVVNVYLTTEFMNNKLDNLAFNILLIIIILNIALFFVLFSNIKKRVLLPLSRLANNVRSVADGNRDRSIDSEGMDEIGQLAVDVESMRVATNKSIELVQTEIVERREAENKLKRRTEELEKVNKAFVGRELKMVELKKEIKELKKGLKT